jgi:6-pyruvoyltetrahydropterin/6-carboxytetrahydropterin synthase
MFVLEKELKPFSAAHRLIKGYEGKCKHLHGHNYRIRVSIASQSLHDYDFVMDFSDIKKLLGRWVQENLDHSTLVSDADDALLEFLQQEKMKHYIFPNGVNTTAEVLSKHLFTVFAELLKQYNTNHSCDLCLMSVKLYETDYSIAMYKNPED